MGSTSFAAQGLLERLTRDGHEVFTYDRRSRAGAGPNHFSGSLQEFVVATSRLEPIHVLVNFVLMKGESVESNLKFLQFLREFASARRIGKFIHVSSISVISASADQVTELTPIESNVRHKGDYSKLKILTEQWLRDHWDQGILEILRPGFILGPGLQDPAIGIGKVLACGWVMELGISGAVVPLLSREQLVEAIARLTMETDEGQQAVRTSMLVASNSPTREEYLNFCLRELGMGRRMVQFSKFNWILGLMAGTVVFSLLKRRWSNLVARMNHSLSKRRYDARITSKRLGLTLELDWKSSLLETRQGVKRNYALPQFIGDAGEGGSNLSDKEAVLLYVGCGRIVREKHFPALERMGFKGTLEWWDPYVSSAPRVKGINLRRIRNLSDSAASRAIVATPAFARESLGPLLPQSIHSVLFEKPFGTSREQADRINRGLPSGMSRYVLHNYRFKRNVKEMLCFLRAVNSGRLLSVRLRFDSPSVANDGAIWLRREREHRTLLMDYAIHFMDLALFMLPRGNGTQLRELITERNHRDETSRISGEWNAEGVKVHFHLRQGGNERVCELEYVFEHYTCQLGFFPETFEVKMGRRTFLDGMNRALTDTKSAVRAMAEKFGGFVSEVSHQEVLSRFLSESPDAVMKSLDWDEMRLIYQGLFDLGEMVYGTHGDTLEVPDRRSLAIHTP